MPTTDFSGDGFPGLEVGGLSATFPGKLGILQRVLPTYRTPFFDMLATSCTGGLGVFAGLPRKNEAIEIAGNLSRADYTQAKNIHILAGALYLCWQVGLLHWLDRFDPDVLIVEANPRYLSTRLAIRWMKQRSRPVVGWGLGAPVIQGPLAGWRKSRRSRFIEPFEAILTYSQRGAQEYRDLGYPPERIFVAPNAVAPRPKEPIRERPPYFDGKPCVLFVGRLQKRKRVDALLRACADLPAEIRPRLVIVGDGPERNSLELLAKEVFPGAEFPGAIHGKDLTGYYEAADLFVLPGTGGLAIQEAMSQALPVIVARGDGTQDDLVRPGNGWQIPPDDLAVLSATLQTALKDAPLLRRMGSESQRIVSEEINLERMVEVFVEVASGLLRK